jgi:hypothetical protein
MILAIISSNENRYILVINYLIHHTNVNNNNMLDAFFYNKGFYPSFKENVAGYFQLTLGSSLKLILKCVLLSFTSIA